MMDIKIFNLFLLVMIIILVIICLYKKYKDYKLRKKILHILNIIDMFLIKYADEHITDGIKIYLCYYIEVACESNKQMAL